ncbi:transglutaminase domain-containing protein [Methanobrevibacter sp. TMH8]|uniref:transglutaminase domain-containing protein n=1 Tax=Methanobrevibacter sp. TMH8 TaxID=2848611 RepID=UPI001CCC35C7|nr:transglutaminase domain-containing protein [Methanobrevibacter sp. TMH8]MBZ9571170.1 transglutaminase domain-containing protein [Methanobrevibacter sp. TMH8]
MFCATPFGGSLDTQNSVSIHGKDIVKASAGTKVVDKTNTTDSTVKNLKTVKNSTKTKKVVVNSVKMYKKDYKQMVKTINNYEDSKGYKPSTYSWKAQGLNITKKSYLDAINRYTEFVKKFKKDPNYVNIFNAYKYVVTSDSSNKNIKKSASLPLAGELQGKKGLTLLQKYMNKHLNHRDGGPSTFAGVVKSKVGDCWGLADWAAHQLQANNYKTRIVQGATSASSRHRWVQVSIDGKWINFESSLVTKKYGSKSYSKTCARVSKIIRTL